MVRPESVHVNATHASTGATCTALFPCKGFCVRSGVHPQICKTALRVAGNVAEHERQAVCVAVDVPPEPCPLCALVMALVGPRAGLLRDWLASPRRVTKPPEADTRGSEHVDDFNR